MAPSIVQTKSGSTTAATSVTVTLTSATTAGNCLVAVVYAGATSITGITLGGSAGNWASQKSLNTTLTGTVAIWADPNCAGGQTSVVVTQGSSNQMSVLVYEVSGLATSSILDASSSNGPTALQTSAWTSNATGTTTQASELAIGAVGGFNNNFTSTTLTGPSSPWVNETQVSATTGVFLLTGYDILSSTGTVTYSGTSNISGTNNAYIAVAATFIAASASVTSTGSAGLGTLGASGSGTVPIPVTSTGSAGLGGLGATGVAAGTSASFPQTPLGAKVELDLNGTWTDITTPGYIDYARQEITLTRGHADESTTASPASLDLALVNTDARFSDTNPTGPWYGLLGRNTPVRLSIPAQTTYLRLENDAVSSASCPDATGLHITGSIDIRLDVGLTDWTPAILAAKWDGGGCWALLLNSNGTLLFAWYDSSSSYHTVTSDAAIPVSRRQSLRATLSATTGTVTFYTAPAIGGSWTQVGDAISGTGGAATSLNSASSPLKIGYSVNWATYGEDYLSLQGAVYELQVYNGIAGTLAADPVFSAQPAGYTSFADAQGNTWTLTGTAELSARNYRAHLEASAFTPNSDVTGKSVYMQLNASGILRRIQQGKRPLESALRYALPSAAGLVGYWPCEDGNDMSGAGGTPGSPSQFASAVAGVPPGNFTATPTFASDSSFVCSYPLPVLNGSSFKFVMPSRAAADTANVVRFLAGVPSGGDTAGSVLARVYTTGTVAQVDLKYGTGGTLELIGYNSSGTQLFDTGAVAFAVNGQPLWISIELQTSGSSVTYDITTVAPGAGSGVTTTGTQASATIGNTTAIVFNPGGPMTGTAIGHVTCQTVWTSLFTFATQLNAYQGEHAADRFARLCAEQNIPCRIYGPPDDSVVMGAQTPLALTDLLQECADADRGQIYEPRTAVALGYRTRASMQQQAVAVALDFSADDLASFVDAIEDDQYTINDAVVTRAYTSTGGTGSSAEVAITSGPLSTQAPPAGVGPYITSATLNLNTDSQCGDLAGWLTSLGTTTGLRYPGVTYDLAKAGIGTLLYSLPAADIGDRLTIGNFPAWLPPDGADQLIMQTTETIGEFQYRIKWVCVPDAPYLTAIADNPVFGRADTPGSTVHTGISSTATSMLVDTPLDLWSTAAGDVPFDIEVSGERMTVTAISGSSSPQTFTVTRSVNGVVKAQTAGTDVRLFYPPLGSL